MPVTAKLPKRLFLTAMLRRLSASLFLPGLLATALGSACFAQDKPIPVEEVAQEQPSPESKARELKAQQDGWKRSVDGAIRKLAEAKLTGGREAAVYLLALVHCHRRYGLEDGPVLRPALQLLFQARGNDGLFRDGNEDLAGTRLTTAYAYQALHDLDAEKFAEDLAATRRAFGKRYSLKGPALERALRPYPGDKSAKPFSGEERKEIRSMLSGLLSNVAAWNAAGKELRAVKLAESRPFESFEQRGLESLLRTQKGGIWRVPGPGGKLFPDPGTTALCLTALAGKPKAQRSAEEESILEQGIAFLKSSQRKDGSFSEYTPNYIACAAVMAIATAGLPGCEETLLRARKFILSLQNVERRGYRSSDRDYGSIGYGGDRRGDLSNTQFALEALRLTGLDSDDEAFQKALIYLRRTQNLPGKGSYRGPFRTEEGKKLTVRAGEDGGAAYYPGVSTVGYDEASNGEIIARSYGSMTYALLKCYVLAGLDKDDPRLSAALNWTVKNFTVEENPGVKKGLPEKTRYQGLYYYYLTMARAYAFGKIDKAGDRDWRKALRGKLKKEQQKDGSWVNQRNGRWFEMSPMVCTAYALIALRQ